MELQAIGTNTVELQTSKPPLTTAKKATVGNCHDWLFSDSEGQSLIFWLSVEAGEINLDLVLASDHARTVLSSNGVCIDNMAVVGLQVHKAISLKELKIRCEANQPENFHLNYWLLVQELKLPWPPPHKCWCCWSWRSHICFHPCDRCSLRH